MGRCKLWNIHGKSKRDHSRIENKQESYVKHFTLTGSHRIYFNITNKQINLKMIMT